MIFLGINFQVGATFTYIQNLTTKPKFKVNIPIDSLSKNLLDGLIFKTMASAILDLLVFELF